MENILVSKENLEIIMKAVVTDLYKDIDNIDLSEVDKAKLEVLNHIITNGDGSKYLANNGQYVSIDVDNINTLSEKINTVYDLFNIVGNEYTIDLPEHIQTKLNIIKNDGDGTKALSDDGTYKDITNALVSTLTDEEINTLVSEINALI